MPVAVAPSDGGDRQPAVILAPVSSYTPLRYGFLVLRSRLSPGIGAAKGIGRFSAGEISSAGDILVVVTTLTPVTTSTCWTGTGANMPPLPS